MRFVVFEDYVVFQNHLNAIIIISTKQVAAYSNCVWEFRNLINKNSVNAKAKQD